MYRIQSPNRGIALVGAGYYRQLTSNEEVEQSSPLISAHYSGNDRQFDLWVSMSMGGIGASEDRVTVAISEASTGKVHAANAESAAKAAARDSAAGLKILQSQPTGGGSQPSEIVLSEAQLQAVADRLAEKLPQPNMTINLTGTGKAA